MSGWVEAGHTASGASYLPQEKGKTLVMGVPSVMFICAAMLITMNIIEFTNFKKNERIVVVACELGLFIFNYLSILTMRFFFISSRKLDFSVINC